MSAKAILSASVSAPPVVYVEDVFSTFLYTGNGSTQTITNGIDLSGKGGLIWTKHRDDGSAGLGHFFWDTVRGNNGPNSRFLRSNSTNEEQEDGGFITSTSSTGYTVGNTSRTNASAGLFCSWTFREQPKFFDIVTYTGTGSNTTIPHNLGSVPGCIIVKRRDSSGYWWAVYHRSLATANNYLLLQETSAQGNSSAIWNGTNPTNTVFSVGTSADTNASGGTYIAYLFAHDAGGFGTAGTDNVVSCGSYAGTSAANNAVSLGWEPQWVMIKEVTVSGGGWFMFDNMRGMPVSTVDAYLSANASDIESSPLDLISPTATGFNLQYAGGSTNTSGRTYIYIAIRRGPMKTPTVGTEVFSPTYTSSAANPLTVTTNFPVDLSLNRAATGSPTWAFSRLTGANSNTAASTKSSYLQTSSTAAESAPSVNGDSMQSNTALIDVNFNASDTTPKIYWNFRRAPGFFDVVCYTGTGGTNTLSHNLAAIPELIITKKRIDVTSGGAAGWIVMSSAYPGGFISGGSTSFGQLQSAAAVNIGAGGFLQSIPTSTTFTLLGGNYQATDSFVAYLFATCAGVSKVGSYTGTGTTLQVNCGFTAGARFVLIKRTDSTGDWYVWDTARGIISGNDPYLLLNSTAAEVTGTDYIDPLSSGFEISSTAPAAINANGGTYIFLAIA